MDCALWLDKKKVYSAEQIPENPDLAALRGYFLGGSLVSWLRGPGGEEYARRLSKLSPDDPELNEKIAEIFDIGENGAKAPPINSKGFGGASCADKAASPCSYLPEYFSSGFGSFPFSSVFFPVSSGFLSSFSFETGSFGSLRNFLGSYGGLFGGSFAGAYGSYNIGSFENFFGLYEYFFGSFKNFSGGSFNLWEWEWEWLWRYFSSFSYGSFSFGSYSFESFGGFGSFSEWLRLLGIFGSFGLEYFGSFWSLAGFGNFGSFGSFAPIPFARLPLDEYDLIMLKTLCDCPLDRFGYGIHNI